MRLDLDARFPHLCPSVRHCRICRWLLFSRMPMPRKARAFTRKIQRQSRAKMRSC